jgi:hypothetical protein
MRVRSLFRRESLLVLALAATGFGGVFLAQDSLLWNRFFSGGLIGGSNGGGSSRSFFEGRLLPRQGLVRHRLSQSLAWRDLDRDIPSHSLRVGDGIFTGEQSRAALSLGKAQVELEPNTLVIVDQPAVPAASDPSSEPPLPRLKVERGRIRVISRQGRVKLPVTSRGKTLHLDVAGVVEVADSRNPVRTVEGEARVQAQGADPKPEEWVIPAGSEMAIAPASATSGEEKFQVKQETPAPVALSPATSLATSPATSPVNALKTSGAEGAEKARSGTRPLETAEAIAKPKLASLPVPPPVQGVTRVAEGVAESAALSAEWSDRLTLKIPVRESPGAVWYELRLTERGSGKTLRTIRSRSPAGLSVDLDRWPRSQGLQYRIATVNGAGTRVESPPGKVVLRFEPPLLRNPAQSASIEPAALTPLTWARTKLTDRYEIEVAADRGFSKVLHRSAGPQNVALVPLKDSGRVYWRVRSVAGSVRSRWSEVRELTVGGGS